MIEIEEIFLLKDVPLTTNYQVSLPANISQHDLVDFFIYISDNADGAINTIDCIIEYTAKANPIYNEWTRMSIETFDSDLKIFKLLDYIVRKEISHPTSFSIRCRAQGRLMTLKVKANAAGGNFSIGILRKKRTK